jgi:hypothetical protein
MQVRRAMAACVLAITGMWVMLPERHAGAIELSGGVSVGGIVAGTMPRLAVMPHATLGWRMESGLLVAAHEVFSILPAGDAHGVGVYSQTSADIGYAWDSVNVSLGPSLALYAMPACAPTPCARVAGLAPGGHAQVSVYLAGPFGVSFWGGVDWLGKSSLLRGVVGTIALGPVVRWRSR